MDRFKAQNLNMLQGVDVESAKALTAAVAKLRDKRDEINETTHLIEENLVIKSKFLKNATIQLSHRRDTHQRNIEDMLRILSNLNARNEQLAESNRLSQEACLLVSVHHERLGASVHGQQTLMEDLKRDILQFESQKHQLQVQIDHAKVTAQQRAEELKTARSLHAQRLMEKKRVYGAVDRVDLDNTAVKAILENKA